jgi:hypothetical protein
MRSVFFLKTLALRSLHRKKRSDSSFFSFRAMMQVEDDMEIVIGKLFFLISSAWAFVVLYRIAASLLAHRRPTQRIRVYPPQPPAQPVYSEKPRRAQIH